MHIEQNSQRMAVDFQTFDITSKEAVNILQPGRTAVFLGNIVGGSPTTIFGTLSANGQVLLVNPRGVIFGENSRVDAAALLATSLGVDVDTFMAGALELRFSAEMAGKIINRGVIRAATGGSVVLLGDEVVNEGLITADLGRADLASGSEAVLTFDADGLIGLEVTRSALGSLGGESAVLNTGTIEADGGQIFLTATAARDLFDQAINNEGILRANSAQERNGEIVLMSPGDTVSSGEIVAQNDAGVGGRVAVLGDRVAITDGRVDVSGAEGGGEILIGGEFQGQGDTPTASRTYVGPEAELLADATRAGDGGRVIVWADDVTRFFGTLRARGGAESGDGGFAEVSGKGSLTYEGKVDLQAPEGERGTLLLDPKNIDINDVGTDAVADNDIFGDNAAASAVISSNAVESALDGSNLRLEASNDIVVTSALDSSGGGTGDLTMRAGRSVDINANISLNGDLNIEANTDDTGVVAANRDSGDATINFSGFTIDTSAGSGAVTFAYGPGVNGNDATGAMSLGGIETGGGAVTIRTEANEGGATSFENVVLNDAIDTGGGDVTINAGELTNINSATITTTGGINAPGGDVMITTNTGDLVVAGITTDGGQSTGALPGQNAGDISLTSAAELDLTASLSAAGSNSATDRGGSGGLIDLVAGMGDLSIDQTLTLSGGTGIVPGLLGNLYLEAAAGGVTQSVAITANEVALQAQDEVALTTAGNSIGTLAADIGGSGELFSLVTSSALTVSTVDGLSGVRTNAGTISFEIGMDGDLLTVMEPINAGTSDVVALAYRMAINAQITGNEVTLEPRGAYGLDIGSATDLASNRLELSDAELDLISAVELQLGRAGSSMLNVIAPLTPGAVTGELGLNGRSITLSAPIDMATPGHGAALTITANNVLTIEDGSNINSAGAVTLMGGTGISIAGDITTMGNLIRLNGDVTLADEVVLSLLGGMGSIVFANTVNGTQRLQITAGNGSVDFMGEVGGSDPLMALAVVSAQQVDTTSIRTTDEFGIRATNISINGTGTRLETTGGGNLTLTGELTLAGSGLVTLATGGTMSDENITVTGAIRGMGADDDLVATAGTGRIDLQGDLIGLRSLNIAAAARVDVMDVTTVGDLQIMAMNIDINGADTTLETDGGNLTLTGTVVLDGSGTITLTTDGTSSDGNIKVDGDMAGVGDDDDLVLTAGTGTINLRRLNGLKSLNVMSASQIDIRRIATIEDLSITATDIDINGAGVTLETTGGGDLTLDGDVDLDGRNTVTLMTGGAGGDISVTGEIRGTAGNDDLEISAGTGSVTLGGAASNLQSLVLAAGSQAAVTSIETANALLIAAANIDINGAGVTLETTGGGDLTLGGDVGLNGSGTITLTTDGTSDGDISIMGEITGTGGNDDLVLTAGTGSVMLGGAALNLGSLSIMATNIDLNGATLETTGGGDLTLDGTVDLDGSGAITLTTGAAGGNISVTGAITGTGGNDDLVAEAGTGTIDFQRDLSGLQSLNVRSASQIDAQDITTTGDLSITATNIDLNGAGTMLATTGGGDLTLDGAVGLDGSGTITLMTDGTSDGDISVTGAIMGTGGNDDLVLTAGTGSVTLEGAASNLLSLMLTASQADVTSIETTNALLIAAADINLNGGARLATTGGRDLTLTGAVMLDGTITLTTGGAGGNISVTGAITGAGGNDELEVVAGTGSIDFQGNLSGLRRLNVMSASQIDVEDITTTRALSITADNIDLNGARLATSGSNLTLDGAVDLDDRGTITLTTGGGTGGNISVTGAITGTGGNDDLVLTAGTGSVTLGDAALNLRSLVLTAGTGSQADVMSIQTDNALSITAANINLSGGARLETDGSALTLDGAVALNGRGATTLTTGGAVGNIRVTGEITGAGGNDDLVLTAGMGTIDFRGDLSGLRSLNVMSASRIDVQDITTTGALSITATNIDLNGASLETTGGGDLTLDGAVRLDGSGTITLMTDGTSDGDISVTGAIEGNGNDLVLTAGTGSVTLGSAALNLQSLVLTAGSQVDVTRIVTVDELSITAMNIDLNGTSTMLTTSGGDLTLDGVVDLDGMRTITLTTGAAGGDISVGAIVGTAGGDDALVLTAGTGSVTLGGAASNLRSLALTAGSQADVMSIQTDNALSITAANINLNGGARLETGGSTLTLTGAVDLDGAITLTTGSGTGGNISVTGAIMGSGSDDDLVAEAGTGTIDFQGDLSGLRSLNVMSARQIDVQDITTTGDLSIAAINIDLNGASLTTTGGGDLTLAGAVDLDGSGTITLTTDGTSDGDISVTGAITGTGNDDLEISAGTGSVTLDAASTLQSLSITAMDIAITGTDTTLRTDGGDLTLTGAVDLDGSGTITLTTGAAGGHILVTGEITGTDGDDGLVAEAGTDTIEFRGDLINLQSLAMSATQIDVRSITTAGALSITAMDIAINGRGEALATSGGNLTLEGAVNLQGRNAFTLTTGSGTGGNISVTGAITGMGDNDELRVEAGTGTIEFRGDLIGLQSLNVMSASQIDVQDITTTDELSITATNIDLNSAGAMLVTSGGDLTLDGAVDLDGSGTITLTTGVAGGDISAGAIAGNGNDLVLTAGTGSVTLGGAASNLQSLVLTAGSQAAATSIETVDELSITATNIDITGMGATLETTGGGDLTLDGTVDLDGSRMITLTTDGTSDGNISVTGEITGTGGNDNLVLTAGTGSVMLGGSALNLGSLSITAANIDLNGAMLATGGGDLTLDGAVDLDGSGMITLTTGATGGDISITGAITGTDGDDDLVAEAGMGTIDFRGGLIGLRSLNVMSASQIDVQNNITTTGDLSITADNIDLNVTSLATTAGGDLTLMGDVDLSGSGMITLTTDGTPDGDISVTGTITGTGRDDDLVLTAGTGSVTLGGTASSLQSLVLTAANINLNGASLGTVGGGDLTLTGAVELDGAITLMTGAGGGDISVTGEITGTGGNDDLVLTAGTGSVMLGGAALNLGSLSITATNIDLNGATLETTGGGDLTLDGTVDLDGSGTITLTTGATGGDISVMGAITGTDGDDDLVLTAGTGSVTLDAASNLQSLLITATNIDLNGATLETTGGGDLTLMGDVDLGGSGTITLTTGGATGGDISVTGAITGTDGDDDLVLTAGTGSVTLEGASSNLRSLALTAMDINLNSATLATSGGNLTLDGAVELDGAIRLTTGATGGDISVTGAITGAGDDDDLVAEAGTGTIDFQGNLIGLRSLNVMSASQIDVQNNITTTGDLSITATNIDLNVASLATTAGGDLTLNGAVVLGGSGMITLTTDGTSDGDISVMGVLTGDGDDDLVLTAGTGSVTLGGVASNLQSLVLTAGSQAAVTSIETVNDLSITATNIDITGTGTTLLETTGGGNLTLMGDVDLDGSGMITLTTGATGGDISTGAIAGDGDDDLVLTAGTGSVTLGGAASNLRSLVLTASQADVTSIATADELSIMAANIDITGTGATLATTGGGDLTLTGAVDLDGSGMITLTTDGTSDGDISVTGVITGDGDDDLVAEAGTGGTIDFQGNLIGLRSLNVISANQIDVQDITTTGALSITATNIDLNGAGATLATSGGDLTLAGVVDLDSSGTITLTTGSAIGGDINVTGAIEGTVAGDDALVLTAGMGSVTLAGAASNLQSLALTASQAAVTSIETAAELSITAMNIDVTGTGTTLETTGGGDLTLMGDVDLDGSGTITLTTGAAGGDISVTGAIAGTGDNDDLVLTAGTGSVTLGGAASSLRSLVLTASQADVMSIATADELSITATNNIDITGTGTSLATTGGGDLTLTGAVNLNGSGTIRLATDGTSDGNISVTGVIMGTGGDDDLVAEAGTGTIDFQSDLSGLRSLNVMSASQIDVEDITTTMALSITATNIDLNGASLATTDGGDLTLTGAVDLDGSGAITLTTDGTSDGNISVTGAITGDGDDDLALTADTGSVTLGGVASNLRSLALTASAVNIASTETSNALSITAANIELNGATLETMGGGDLTLTGAVELDGAVRLTTGSGTGGNIRVTGEITGTGGDDDLVAEAGTGRIDFQNEVSDLRSLTVRSASQIDVEDITTTGALSITATNIDLNDASLTTTDGGDLTLDGAVDLDGMGTITLTTDGTSDGNISVTGAITGTGGDDDLVLTAGTGSVTLDTASNLQSLLITAMDIAITGTTLATTGAGDLTLMGDVNLDGSGTITLTTEGTPDGDISVTGAITGTGGDDDLVLAADTGSVTLGGAASNLRSLVLTASQADVMSIETTGATTDGALSITATNINLNGASLETTGGGNLTLTGVVELDGAIRLATDGTSDDGDISVTGAITGMGDDDDLEVAAGTGNIDFQSDLSGLRSLNVMSANQIAVQNITTTGALSITAMNIDLNGATLATTDGGNLTLDGAVDLDGSGTLRLTTDGTSDGNISVTGAITGTGDDDLEVAAGTGSVTLGGAASNLQSLALTAGSQADVTSIATVNDLSITAANIDVTGTGATLATTGGGDLTLTGTVDLDGSGTITLTTDGTSDGDISVTGAITGTGGDDDLVLTAGTGSVTLGGDASNLQSLALAATTINLNGASLATTGGGDLTLTGAVELDGAITLTTGATGGDISVTGAITGMDDDDDLVAEAGTGTIEFRGDLSGLRSLNVMSASEIDVQDITTAEALSITATNIDLNGARLATTGGGDLTLAGAVDLDGSGTITLTTAGTSDGNISVTGAITGDGDDDLEVAAGTGNIDFQSDLIGLRSLNVMSAIQIDVEDITTTGPLSITATNIDLNGASLATSGGNLTLDGAVDLDDSGTITLTTGGAGGNISVTGAITGTDGNDDLVLAAGTGSVILEGAASNLRSLALTAANINLNGASLETTGGGDLTLTGAVELDGAITLTTGAAGGDISVTGAITGVGDDDDLVAEAGTGSIDFQSNLSDLRSLTVRSASQIDVQDITTTGALSVTATNIDLNGARLATTGGGDLTLAGAVDLDGSGTITLTTAGTSDGNINVTGVIVGNDNDLVLTAGTGSVTLGGAAANLQSLALTAGSQADVTSIATANELSITATNIDVTGTGATLETSGGDLTLTGAVDLDGSGTITLTTDATTGGNISVTGAITGTGGDDDLEVAAGTGTIDFQGNLSGLRNLNVMSASQIDVQDITTAMALSITATNIDLNGASLETTGGGDLTLDGAVDLDGTISLTTDGTSGGDISVTGVITGAGGDDDLVLTSGMGSMSFEGAVGAATGGVIRALTITQSGGVEFQQEVTVGALTLMDTMPGETVSVLGDLTATTLTVRGSSAYNVSLTGSMNRIGGLTRFAHTGLLMLGDGGDIFDFADGVVATAPSRVDLNGTVRSASGAITLGDTDTELHIAGTSLLGGAATDAITLADAGGRVHLQEGAALTIGTGLGNRVNLGAVTAASGARDETLVIDTRGAVDVDGVVGATGVGVGPLEVLTITRSGGVRFREPVSVGTLAIMDTVADQTVDFDAVLSATSLSALIGTSAYSVNFDVAPVVGTGEFANRGGVTFAAGGVFAQGVQVSGGRTNLTGSLMTNGTALTLGAVSLEGDASVASTGGVITLGPVDGDGATGRARAFTINAGLTGSVAGVSVTDTASLTVVDASNAANAVVFTGDVTSSGAVDFNGTQGGTYTVEGALNAAELTTAQAGSGDEFTLVLNGGGMIVGAVVFDNAGGVTLGDGADVFTFQGGVDTSGVGGQVLLGARLVTGLGQNLTLGAVTLGAATSLDSNGGRLTLGAVTGASHALTLDAGLGQIEGLSVDGVTTLTVLDAGDPVSGNALQFAGSVSVQAIDLNGTQGGTYEFADALTTTTFTTNAADDGNADFSLALVGGVSVTGPDLTRFDHVGLLRLGNDGDVSSFRAGLLATVPDAIAINGSVTAVTGEITLGDLDSSVNVSGISRIGGASTGQITTGAIQLMDGTTLTLGDGTAASPMTLASIVGEPGAAEVVVIDTAGQVTVTGDVGASANDFDRLTIEQSGGVVFEGTVFANSVNLIDTAVGRTVEFAGDVQIARNLNVGVGTGAYNVSLLGGTTSIGGSTQFLNAGTLNLGDAATDMLAFAGGVAATAPAIINLGGAIATSSGAIILGDADSTLNVLYDTSLAAAEGERIALGLVNLAAGRSLQLGMDADGLIRNNPVELAGVIGIADVDAMRESLILATRGGVMVSAAIGSDDNPLDELTITQSGGTTFAGPVNVVDLTLADTEDGESILFENNLSVTGSLQAEAQPYSVELLGSNNRIDGTGPTRFLNTGTVRIGDAQEDVSIFLAGLDTVGAGATTLAGTLRTSDSTLALGATTLTGPTHIASGAAELSIVSITGDAWALSLQDNDTDQAGDVTLLGAFDLGALTTGTGAFDVRLESSGRVRGATRLANSGLIVVGTSASDELRFDAGLTASAGTTDLFGLIEVMSGGISLERVRVAGATRLRSNGNDIDLGAVSGAASLSLETAGGTASLTSLAGENVIDATLGAGSLMVADGFMAEAVTLNAGAAFIVGGDLSIASAFVNLNTGRVEFNGAADFGSFRSSSATGELIFRGPTTVTGSLNIDDGVAAMVQEGAPLRAAALFENSLTVGGDLQVGARAIRLLFNDDVTISGRSEFRNTEEVVLGSDDGTGTGDRLSFEGGLDVAGPLSVFADISTAGAAGMQLNGRVTLTGSSEFQTSGGAITTTAIVAGAADLSLNSNGGAIAIGDRATGTGLSSGRGDVSLSSGGGDLTVGTITSTAGDLLLASTGGMLTTGNIVAGGGNLSFRAGNGNANIQSVSQVGALSFSGVSGATSVRFGNVNAESFQLAGAGSYTNAGRVTVAGQLSLVDVGGTAILMNDVRAGALRLENVQSFRAGAREALVAVRVAGEANLVTTNSFETFGTFIANSLVSSRMRGSITLNGGGALTTGDLTVFANGLGLTLNALGGDVFRQAVDVALASGTRVSVDDGRFFFGGGVDTSAAGTTRSPFSLVLNNSSILTDNGAVTTAAIILRGNSVIDTTLDTVLAATDQLNANAGADITITGDVTDEDASFTLNLYAGADQLDENGAIIDPGMGGDIDIQGAVTISSLFIRSGADLELNQVSTSGNTLRAVVSGDVVLNGDLIADRGDIEIITIGGTITQAVDYVDPGAARLVSTGQGAFARALLGDVIFVAKDRVTFNLIETPVGHILLALVGSAGQTTGGRGFFRGQSFGVVSAENLGGARLNGSDLIAGGTIVIVSPQEANFGTFDNGFLLDATTQFISLGDSQGNRGNSFIQSSTATSLRTLPEGIGNDLAEAWNRNFEVEARRWETPLSPALFQNLNVFLQQQPEAITALTSSSADSERAQSLLSQDEEPLTNLSEDVFQDITLVNQDQQPLCLPKALQGFDSVGCPVAGEKLIASWVDEFTSNLFDDSNQLSSDSLANTQGSPKPQSQTRQLGAMGGGGSQ